MRLKVNDCTVLNMYISIYGNGFLMDARIRHAEEGQYLRPKGR